MRERKCDDAGFTPEERLRERQSLETKALLIELRSLLDSNGQRIQNLGVGIIRKLSIIRTVSGKRSLLTWMTENSR